MTVSLIALEDEITADLKRAWKGDGWYRYTNGATKATFYAEEESIVPTTLVFREVM